MARLIFNTHQRDPKEFVPHATKDELIERAHEVLARRPNTPGINQASFHIQAALGAIRDDPVQDIKLEKWKTDIYHHLSEAMNVLVTGPPKEPAALQGDLDSIMGMGGEADGTTDVSEVHQVQSTTTE